jgi:hypothetical protein
VARAEHADAAAAVARGLVGDHLGDVQAGHGQVGPWPLQGHVGGVVRADEEVRPGGGQPRHAHRQGGPDRVMVAGVPGGHAAGQGDAVHGHVGVVVGAEPGEPLLAEGAEAQRRPLGAVGEDAKVPQLHDRLHSTMPVPAGARPPDPGRRLEEAARWFAVQARQLGADPSTALDRVREALDAFPG